MSKIKFSKEWYRDNDIVINCRTKEEVNKFIEELAKVEVTEWISGELLEDNYYFSKYKEHTCYTLEEDYKISYSSIEYFVDDSSIIRFSDLEFESEIELNEDDLGYEEFDNSFNKLEDIMSAISPKKSIKLKATVVKPDPIKRTILRESVELKNGDVFEIIYSNVKSIGIVIDDYVLYNDGTWDSLDITNNITWIIYGEDIKSMSIGHEISQLLFKNKLDDELKDFMTYLIDKPKEIETKTYKVKFTTMNIELSDIYICDEILEVGDYVTIDCGTYAYQYGKVYSIIIDKSSQDIIDNTYDKVTKIK